MNVLAIGNSFSEDATRYLHQIARADGEKINVVNLYIGGCPLDRHYRNMLSEERAYELQYNGHKTGFHISLGEALLNRSWDVVTLQQVSSRSFDAASYQPYASELANYVKMCAPKAKIYMHETWAYENGSQKLLEVAKYPTSEAMLADIIKANSEIAELISADGIIRSGEILGELMKKELGPIHRDSYHASLGLGRYALGLTWYRTLTKNSVSENQFCDFDAFISEDTVLTIKETVDALI